MKLPLGLRRNPACRDSSNVRDSVLHIRQQSLVDAVQPVHVHGQCLGDVPQALRLDLFKFVEVLHILGIKKRGIPSGDVSRLLRC